MSEEASEKGAADTFCVLAWKHLQIAPNGTIKMCCVAGEDLHEGGRPLNVYADDFKAIWNSKYMRDARRGLANGERISPCTRCFTEEDTVGESRRTAQNAHWLPIYGKTAVDFISETEANDWQVEDRPDFLQLNMGNLCNLACRMCSSQYSSRIESDAVHNKWMPPHALDVARWRGDRLSVGPRAVVGVDYSGLHPYEANAGLRWSDGHARFAFPIEAETRLKQLHLNLYAAPGVGGRLRVLVNGNEVIDIAPPLAPTDLAAPLANVHNADALEIEVVSESARFGSRNLGVAIRDVRVERISPPRIANARALSRFQENSGWWGQRDFMLGELMADPRKLRRIIFQGGEPFLIKEVEEALDHLIAAGAAENVTLEIVSNLTTLDERVLAKLAQFRSVEIGPSIDAIGADFEYIRYPARWEVVERNLFRIAQMDNVVIQVNVAIQLYNLMRITDLLGFCDLHGMDALVHFLVGPAYLNVLVSPPEARRVASDRLRAYAERGGRTANVAQAHSMLRHLEQNQDAYHRQLVRELMLFTNDMDVSRGQSFRGVHAELTALFEADGLPWIDETRHAGPKTEQAVSASPP